MADFSNTLNVICLESEAFYALIDEVVQHIENKSDSKYPKWVETEDAKEILHIKSDTKLKELRDKGAFRYSKPGPKLVLYQRDSLYGYLEKHAKG